MTAYQLPLPIPTFREWELTPFDRELWRALEVEADPHTGLVQSLCRVTMRHGLSYWYSLYRLGWLNQLSCIRVERAGPGKPLSIWVSSPALWLRN